MSMRMFNELTNYYWKYKVNVIKPSFSHVVFVYYFQHILFSHSPSPSLLPEYFYNTPVNPKHMHCPKFDIVLSAIA